MLIQNKVVEHKVNKRETDSNMEIGKDNDNEDVKTKTLVTTQASLNNDYKVSTAKPSLNYDDYDDIAVTVLPPPSPKFFYQFGIVSFGEKKTCGEGSRPGVYTAIYPYIQWILDNYE